jgi:hypothetical protein
VHGAPHGGRFRDKRDGKNEGLSIPGGEQTDQSEERTN